MVEGNFFSYSYSIVVDTASGLRRRRPWVRILVGEKYFFLLQNVQAGSGAHQAPYSMGTVYFCRGVT